MIIDCHTHLNNYDTSRRIDLNARYHHLRQEMDANGVDFACVLSSYKVNEHRPHVREIIEVAQDDPAILPIAGVSLDDYSVEDLHELRDLLAGGVVRGLKIYPGYEHYYPYDNRCEVLYDLALEFDVPVMIHTGDTFTDRGKLRFAHPLNVDDVAVDHPGLKLVICHLGNPWLRDGVEVVYKNEHVYADISGLVCGRFRERFKRVMLDELRASIIYMGQPQFLLYGTDWPICSMTSYLEFVADLDISDDAREGLLWRNAAELFRIDVGAAA